MITEDYQVPVALAADDAGSACRLIVEVMQEGAVVISAEGEITYANRAFSEMLKIPSGELAGQYLASFVVERHRDAFRDLLAPGGKGAFSRLEELVDSRGRHVPVYIRSTPARDGDSAFACMAIADLTHVAASEKAERLAQQRLEYLERLDHLIAISKAILAEMTIGDLLQRVADAAREVTESRSALAACDPARGEFVRCAASGAEPDACIAEYAVSGALAGRHETLRTAHDDLRAEAGCDEGRAVPRGVMSVPLTGGDGEVIGVVGVIDKAHGDFTCEDETMLTQLAALASLGVRHIEIAEALSEAKLQADERAAESDKAREKIRETADDLRRSNHDLQQFAYVASHDLQEPLRAVTSYLQLLERRYQSDLDDDARRFIGFAASGATRMSNLINDLLTYSRVGTQKKAPTPTDARVVLARAMANLRQSILDSGAVITFDHLPMVMGDPLQLGQLFQNLMHNAIKFRGENPECPRIHVGSEERGAAWVFSVRDNGIGIEERHFERIFTIFQRLHSRDEYSGTGIGLAICKKIVEQHGGRIWVESEPKNGSTFLFTLPKAPGCMATAPRV